MSSEYADNLARELRNVEVGLVTEAYVERTVEAMFAAKLDEQFFDPGPWVEAAACRTASAETFFDDTQSAIAKAKAICKSCPVSPNCLAYAVEERIAFGIWGGLTAWERRRVHGSIETGLTPIVPADHPAAQAQ